jgi:hypothetical protein
MQRNPLDQFRRQTQPPQQQTGTGAGAGGLQPYVAFKAVDRKQDRLDVKRVIGDSGMPKYAFLVDIRYNAGFETELVLKYTLYEIRIAGKNLEPVRLAIADSRCVWIEAFHPNEHTPPTDPNAPLITSILFEPDETQQKVESKK